MTAVGRAVTGIPDFKERASREVQLVQYEQGQQYQAHYDGRMLPNGVLEGRGTLLVYLNEGFVGGETEFPNIDLKVSPSHIQYWTVLILFQTALLKSHQALVAPLGLLYEHCPYL